MRRLSVLIAGLMLFAVMITGFHHHEDNLPHADCSICVASDHSPALTHGVELIKLYKKVTYLDVAEEMYNLPLGEGSFAPVRAPPRIPFL